MRYFQKGFNISRETKYILRNHPSENDIGFNGLKK
jgi:hypothetical protein